ncbi:hypothetical protein [Serratia proteamaculans]|uniref:hypothetical protein n=1 Tax=Serratia proteamaculans TaxID=28151 RepID=UPI003D04F7B9
MVSYLKAVDKRLVSLIVSGYGEYIPLNNDPGLGKGIYKINLDGCVLSLFENGLAIEFQSRAVDVRYSEIFKITSHLSAAVFSTASATGDVDISIPLEIHLSDEVVIFEVSLLVYSSLLIVLSDLWRSWEG